jgi:hypothetical protein
MQQSGQNHWFISKADKNAPGTDKDIDFYTVKEGPLLPPTTGWVSCNKSASPGPIVMKMEPPADERPDTTTTPTKSALLLQWVRESKLLEEEMLGERMHQQLLARGTPLLTTMSKYQTLTVEDLILLWQKGKEMHGVGEKDTSVAIFTLLCSTIQYQSGTLLKAMIDMIHKDVFPPGPTESFKDNVGYNAVVAMLSLIRNNMALIRMITSKGKHPTRAVILLIWKLLTVDNVMKDERGVQQLIDGSDTTALHTLLISPNHHLCELLKRVLKCTPTNQSTAYRNAYVASVFQSSLQTSIATRDCTPVEESRYVRMLCLINGKY